MRIHNRKKKSRSAAILLIVIFSLLQLTLWGPPFLPALHEKEAVATCQHDHALCGCAPSRIASGTCCCALASISPCCQKNFIQSALEEKAALGAVITSLPCGASEDPLVTASSEAYLLLTIKISDSPVSTTVYPMVTATNRLISIPPPIPPPEA